MMFLLRAAGRCETCCHTTQMPTMPCRISLCRALIGTPTLIPMVILDGICKHSIYGATLAQTCAVLVAWLVDHDMLFSSFADDAMWRETIVGTQHFMDNSRTFLGRLPPLCSTVAWSADTMMVDVMHNRIIGLGRDLCWAAIARLLEVGYYSKSNDLDVCSKVFGLECWK